MIAQRFHFFAFLCISLHFFEIIKRGSRFLVLHILCFLQLEKRFALKCINIVSIMGIPNLAFDKNKKLSIRKRIDVHGSQVLMNF